MNLDTLSIVFTAALICMPIAVLLFLSWWQNRVERTLLWWSGAYLLISVGLALVLPRGLIPKFLSVDAANSLMLLGAAFGWAGARAFNGRTTPLPPMLLGAVAWIMACRIPEFYADFALRVAVFSAMFLVYFAATAHEYWRGRADGLASRYLMIGTCATIAAIYATRAMSSALMPERVVPDYQHPGILVAAAIISPLVLAMANSVLVVALTKERAEAAQRRLAEIDQLTGLLNRGATIDRIGAILAGGAPGRGAMLIFDLDYFKQINDRFGHPTGDGVLREFATIVRRELRAEDILGRIGGEEFLAFLPGVDAQQAMVVAERIRTMYAGSGLERNGTPILTTVSIGIAVANVGQTDVESLLIAADRALYAAKAQGRDRVRFAVAKAA